MPLSIREEKVTLILPGITFICKVPEGGADYTPSGNLKCNYVIHAVGPRWRGVTKLPYVTNFSPYNRENMMKYELLEMLYGQGNVLKFLL
jgi:O-acetyl-ADP-ribose deacetylase (regulator of RNase III)